MYVEWMDITHSGNNFMQQGYELKQLGKEKYWAPLYFGKFNTEFL